MADSSRHKLVKAFRLDEEDEAGGGKRRKLEGRDKISITDLEKVVTAAASSGLWQQRFMAAVSSA